MKKYRILWLAALLVWVGATAAAQERRGDDGKRPTATERAEMRTARMTEALGLTAEQQEQVRALNLERAKNMEALCAARKANEERLKEVLTPEQYARWEQMSARGAHRGHDVRKGCRHAASGCCDGDTTAGCCRKKGPDGSTGACGAECPHKRK